MRRNALIVVAAVFGLATLVPAAGQDLSFDRVVISVSGDRVAVEGIGLVFTGAEAAGWRRCIDGGSCPVPGIEGQTSGNNDGTVSSREVDLFQDFVLNALPFHEDYNTLRNELKVIIKIDDLPARFMSFTRFTMDGATGSTSSTAPIHVDVALDGQYDTDAKADAHRITIERIETNYTIARLVVVQAAKGWAIDEGSVGPARMQALLVDGRLEGPQDEFEGTQPLTFRIEKQANDLTWVIAGVSLAALLAAVAGFLWYKRKKA